MRRLIPSALVLITMLAATGSACGQTVSEFYMSLLQRGRAFVEAGQNAEAITPLRIAAFGLVDSLEPYQSALIHLAVAQDRLNNQEAAREAVRRVLAAERIQRRYTSLTISPAIRTAFEAAARKSLPASDVTALSRGETVVVPQRTQPVTTTSPSPSTASQQPVAAQPAPQNTTTTRTPVQPAPAQPRSSTPPATATTKSTPAPAKPAAPQPQPATTTTTRPATPASTTATKPAPVTPPPSTRTTPAPAPATTSPATKPALSAREVAARLAEADRALNGAQLTEARRRYRELLETPGLDRDTILRITEGFYRARDFAGALASFRVLGALRRGEEPYGYYHAVSLYETGAYDAARKELSAALPFIELTPDVVRYRAKIEGAR
jgi:tetratricopeptide (TPR) repeat protein